MYHAINRLLIHIKKELITHPNAAFYLTLGTITYTLAVQPDEDVTAHSESLANCLAHILFINWDALRNRATKFYCVTTSYEAESAQVTINKTLGFFQALGAPAPRSQD
ncbi:MAG: hypothetical protein QG632_459 [Candidatus Dependentiae bacterium]|nr:hypothetical protein [Candidatus Dependentiae bacterium]